MRNIYKDKETTRTEGVQRSQYLFGIQVMELDECRYVLGRFQIIILDSLLNRQRFEKAAGYETIHFKCQ